MVHQRLASHPYEEVPAILASHNAHKRNPTAANAEDNSTVIIERLRNDIKEKDVQILQMKQEISILRILERRKQKEIEDIEQANDETPKQMVRLKDENSVLKTRLKQLFSGQAVSDRKFRAQDDHLQKLQKQIEQNEAILKESDLPERAKLQERNRVLEEQVTSVQAELEKLSRKEILTEKNAASEGKTLRSRVTQLEQRQFELEDQLQKKEALIKEKKDEIATLLVYKYNSIHRKAEQQCKACTSRKKQEMEEKRRQEILAKLPLLTAPTVKVVSNTEALLSYRFPGFKAEDFDYSTVTLYHREQSETASEWQSVVLESLNDATPDSKKSKNKRAQISGNQTVLSESSLNLHGVIESTFLLKHLVLGKSYEIYVVPSARGLTGEKSTTVSFQFNVYNLPPVSPQLTIETDKENPRVQLMITPNSTNQGTNTVNFKIEKKSLSTLSCNRSSFKSLLDEQAEELAGFAVPSEITYFVDEKVNNGFWYIYRVRAVNSLGESEPSAWSEAVLVDCLPDAPNSIEASIKSGTSVQLQFIVLEEAQSPLTSFSARVSGASCLIHQEAFTQMSRFESSNLMNSVHSSADSLAETTARPSVVKARSPTRQNTNAAANAGVSNLSSSTRRRNTLTTKEPAEAAQSTDANVEHEASLAAGALQVNPQQIIKQLNNQFTPFVKEFSIPVEQARRKNLGQGKVQWTILLASLTPGVVYNIALAAGNYSGVGQYSDPLTNFEVEYLPSQAEKPEIKLLSPTSFRILLRPGQPSPTSPLIKGYRIYGAKMNWPFSTATFNRVSSAINSSASSAAQQQLSVGSATTGRSNSIAPASVDISVEGAGASAVSKQQMRAALGALNPASITEWAVWQDNISVDVNSIDITSLDFGCTYWLKYSLVTDYAVGEPSEPVMVILSAALPLMPGQAAYKNSSTTGASTSGTAAMSISLPPSTSTNNVGAGLLSVSAGTNQQMGGTFGSSTSLSSIGKAGNKSRSLNSLNGKSASPRQSFQSRTPAKLKPNTNANVKNLPLGANLPSDQKYKNMHEGNPALLDDATESFGTKETRQLQRSREVLSETTSNRKL